MRTCKRLVATITDPRFSLSLLQKLPQSIQRWTPCQDRSFDVLLRDRFSLILQSHTGSGKTLAYLLPLVERMTRDSSELALVVVPTRELASQIGSVADSLMDGVGCAVLSAGARLDSSVPRLVIGTPGAIINNMDVLAEKPIATIVVDEVDRLLDFGFISQLETVLARIKTESVVMASATFSNEINLICKRALRRRPFEEVRIQAPVSGLTHFVHTYQPVTLQSTLESIISETAKNHPESSGLVLFPTTRSLMFFYSIFKSRLPSLGLPLAVYGLHGRMVNEKRMNVSRIFRDINDGPKFLFSTDVAARGLDFPSLSTVFQIGFSGVDDPVSQFVHRAGRTARAGRDGNNILLLCEGLDSDSKLAKQVNELVHLKRLILPQKLTRVEQFDSTSYQRHLSTKCLESLLSWFIERRSGLGIHVEDLKGPGAQLEVKNRIVKAVTDMIRSTGLHQPRISEKTAKKLRIDDLPGLLISKHR